MISNISNMYFAFVKKFKEHVKISIGNLKPPKIFLSNSMGWGTGGSYVGEPGGQAWGNRCGWFTEHCLLS